MAGVKTLSLQRLEEIEEERKKEEAREIAKQVEVAQLEADEIAEINKKLAELGQAIIDEKLAEWNLDNLEKKMTGIEIKDDFLSQPSGTSLVNEELNQLSANDERLKLRKASREKIKDMILQNAGLQEMLLWSAERVIKQKIALHPEVIRLTAQAEVKKAQSELMDRETRELQNKIAREKASIELERLQNQKSKGLEAEEKSEEKAITEEYDLKSFEKLQERGEGKSDEKDDLNGDDKESGVFRAIK